MTMLFRPTLCGYQVNNMADINIPKTVARSTGGQAWNHSRSVIITGHIHTATLGEGKRGWKLQTIHQVSTQCKSDSTA